MSNSLIDDCRSAFEAWAKQVNPLEHRRLLDKQPSGNYTNSTTTLLWTAWQASWKASQESIEDKTDPSYRGCHLEPNA